jgi:hypothetical protein
MMGIIKKLGQGFVIEDESMATPRGFEPLISTVTGWHVNPLHHGAAFFNKVF